jgi:hypothetical protein
MHLPIAHLPTRWTGQPLLSLNESAMNPAARYRRRFHKVNQRRLPSHEDNQRFFDCNSQRATSLLTQTHFPAGPPVIENQGGSLQRNAGFGNTLVLFYRRQRQVTLHNVRAFEQA